MFRGFFVTKSWKFRIINVQKPKTMEAILLATREKMITAEKKMNECIGNSDKNYDFWLGQYQAFKEMVSLLENAKTHM
jgi:hypothetical protein